MRSLLIVFGIALGVGLSVATGAATDSMRNAFDDLIKRIAGRADGAEVNKLIKARFSA